MKKPRQLGGVFYSTVERGREAPEPLTGCGWRGGDDGPGPV